MNRDARRGTIASIIGNGIFGFSFMFSRIAMGVTTPFVMLMYRFIIAFLMLNLVALWSVRRSRAKTTGERAGWLRFDLRGRRVLPLLAMGLIQPVGYFLCESYGIRFSNSTFAGVIIALGPIVALAAAALTLGEIPRRSQVAFSLLSIAGVIVMTVQQQAEGEVRPLGIVLLFGAVLAGTAFNIVSRKLSDEFSALERTYVMMFVAALVFTALALIECGGDFARIVAPLRSPDFLLAILYLGVASSIVAFMALNYAYGYLTVAKSMAFCNMTTVISLFAGVIFLGEPFSLLSLAASVFILLGIWGVQRAGSEGGPFRRRVRPRGDGN